MRRISVFIFALLAAGMLADGVTAQQRRSQEKASSGTSVDGCFRDLGQKSNFGSSEQVNELKSLASKKECPIVGFAFKLASPFARSTLIVADFDNRVMLRLKIDPASRPWEQWSGFSREDVLADNPSDGFDLQNFVSSSGNPPSVPASLSTFIKAQNMQTFLPR